MEQESDYGPPAAEHAIRRGPVRLALIAAGFLSVGLGVLGIFLPLLPTTPFLLLAAACFARSSERFHHWLMTHRVFGPYITNYTEHHALPLGSKIITIALLWLSIGATMIFAIEVMWLRGVLLLIAIGVTTHILRLATAPSGNVQRDDEP